MILLGIETSCDETAVAIVRDGVVVANAVASQTALHAEYGGIVPELATREHLRNLLPLARAALREAGLAAAAVDAVAATQGPGLPPALLIGFQMAQAFALAGQKPFYGIHHHEAHLYSPWVREGPLRADYDAFRPNVALVASGGHTMLVHVRALLDHERLGGTVDDAAGECFDKVAKMLGLPYPGGPEVDRWAETGNPRAHAFPRPMLGEASDDFSFSGLKTAVRYFLERNRAQVDDPAVVSDVCASVQAAIVEVLVTKTIRAALRRRVGCITASGGVICNRRLIAELTRAAGERGLAVRLAPRPLCTDNAAMVALLAEYKCRQGVAPTGVEGAIASNLPLTAR